MMMGFVLKRIKEKFPESGVQRTKVGITAAVLGLASNGLLFAGKLAIGLLSGSVSIMADAMNNLSDAASSVLTLVGFQIAAKPADKEHPYGHERFEYISGLIISILVIYVGLQFLQESFGKVLAPASLNLQPLVFIVLLLSIAAKVWQSRMYRSLGNGIHSETLKATAQDSLNDVMTTAAVMTSAVIEYLSGWQIDGYVGCLMALYILYSGFSMIRTFMDELLGSRPTQEELQAMEDRLADHPDILGYHDLLVHNYGPSKRFASVHIEVNEAWELNRAHQVIDLIEADFKESLGVDLVCHLDPVPVNDRQFMTTYHQVLAIVRELQLDLRMHDFRMENQGTAALKFDLVVPPKCPLKDPAIYEAISGRIAQVVGDYHVTINFDHNYLL